MNVCVPVIIPSYEPDERLTDLLKKLRAAEIGPVILVNDGSGEAYDPLFSEAGEVIKSGQGIILRHERNCGKGRALKTAFSYVLENYPAILGVVTADSDGQHTPESILAMTKCLRDNPDALILGVRKFDGEGIPWKSRFGNNLTEKVFKYVTGVHVSDTQTGLRGIPASFMKQLLDVQGERFEFEMRMLLEAAGNTRIVEIPIETIYDSEENHQTHFDPFKDSIKIYRILCERFLKFIFSSVSSSIVDLVLFSVFCTVFKKEYPEVYAGFATMAARIISALYNYIINYKVVFNSKANVAASGARYVALAIVQMLCSALAITGLVKVFPSLPELLLKMVVDTILFFISYRIQQKLVFSSPEKLMK